MLTKRIIPCLDVDDGRVVKGISFIEIRDAGDPVQLASYYDAEGADELVLLDITASSDSRDIMLNVVREVAERLFIPFTVGGGMRTVADVRRMLEAGADKVSLNTAAVSEPDLVSEASERFGSQCIVVAIDATVMRPGDPAVTCDDPTLAIDEGSRWEVYTHGGRTPTGIDALKWAVRVADLGAGSCCSPAWTPTVTRPDTTSTCSAPSPSRSRSRLSPARRGNARPLPGRPRLWQSRRRSRRQRLPLRHL